MHWLLKHGNKTKNKANTDRIFVEWNKNNVHEILDFKNEKFKK